MGQRKKKTKTKKKKKKTKQCKTKKTKTKKKKKKTKTKNVTDLADLRTKPRNSASGQPAQGVGRAILLPIARELAAATLPRTITRPFLLLRVAPFFMMKMARHG